VDKIKVLKQNLIKVLGKDGISDSETICRQHSRDEGVERNDHTVDLVVWPKSTEECSIIASICYEKKVPMIPFGTGTGLESGVCGVYVI
jgi:D-lactate dehydrogenase (cytochrome)